MKNLLDNTGIATVFLDAALRMRRFTTGSGRVYKLIPGAGPLAKSAQIEEPVA